MQLERLSLRLSTYGADIGKYTGTASFRNQYGEINLLLTSELSNRILQVCAEELVAASKETAQNMTAAILEHKTPLLAE